MSWCLDHSSALVAGPDGVASCPVCGSSWMTSREVAALAPGALGHLAPETRVRSGAFAKQRHCPDCAAPLAPWRIGQVDGWVERCEACDRYWVDRVDRRTFQLIATRAGRQQAFESLAPAERRELAAGLAELTVVGASPQLSPAQSVLAALGVPMLERVEGNKVPFATWTLAAALVFVFVAGRAWPEAWGPEQLAWVPGGASARLLWANFVHFDVVHLVGNLAFLLAFGDAAEQRLSRWWVLLSFVLLGPLTVLAEAALTEPGAQLGGASGAISVLMGAAVVLQPKARIVMVLLRRLPVRVPLLLFGALELFTQVVMALLSVPGVAWYAHLFGLLMGVGLGLAAQARPPVLPSGLDGAPSG